MARTYPRTLLESELKSKGEKRVFEALRDGLDDSWEVFHSVGWVGRDHAEGSIDGEIDFVLLKAGEPILCVEVKGGGIECRHGEWFRLIDGKQERVRDPFAQAMDHRYDLERLIEGLDGWTEGKPLIGHGLWFPDITVHELVLAPDAPPELICDRNDLEDPQAAIERLIAYHRGSRDKRRAPGEKSLEALRDLLAPELRIEVPMASEFLDEEAELITLTHQQALLLNRFAADPRMAIRGYAGSGKTMIAIEQAKRLARNGKRVLYVCFNKALRDHLRERQERSGLEIWNFHGLCVNRASIAEVELPKYAKDEAPPEFYSDELPLALIEAAERGGPKYDAILVDEAQDFHTQWLEALTTLLEDPDEGPIWLFLDDNQQVYGATLEIPKEYRPFDLTVNCRNTQAIHREVIKKYDGEVEPEALGPEGREVELILTDDQPQAVGALIADLCGPQEVPPQDVVVLSAHNRKRSQVGSSKLPGPYKFVEEPVAVGPYIRFGSIRGYKGLESPVVILCELEDLDEKTRDHQLYVGISRARNHCVIVAPGT